jgi:replicative DNA helicase Mcm
LSKKVTAFDARKAINILKHCLMQVGFDPETGQIDIDRISTGVPASTRNKILVIREILKELESRGKKTIPIEDVLAEAAEKNLTESQVEEIIEKLKREGEVYEPKRGWIARL